MKKDKGITLIALVVTIVILIIIATVTINATLGENGLIQGVQEARNESINAMIKEEESLNEVSAQFKNMMEKDSNVSEPDTKWVYDEDGNVTNGKVTLELGDYVDYNCKTGKSITSYESQNGYGNQTFTTDSYNYGWRVLGVNEETGELLIISEDLIGPSTGGGTNGNRTTYYLKGKEGYVNGESELNRISAIYGKGEGATGARSIKVEDINKITGYNPNNVGVYDPEQAGSGEKCYSGEIYEHGNKVTYTRDSETTITYSGENGKKGTESYNQFEYYTGSEWKSLKVGENVTLTSTAYHYYPDTLTNNSSGSPVVGIEKTSQVYKMLFTNTSTGSYSENANKVDNIYYWLASKSNTMHTGYSYVSMLVVYVGYIDTGNIYYSNGNLGNSAYSIRPVVSLKSDILLKNSNTQKDGCTLWNIEI